MRDFVKYVNFPKFFTVYPVGDTHLGSPQSDEHFLTRHILRISKDPTALVVLMSDLTENSIIGSKGDTYEQTMTPDEQLEFAVKVLSPIKDKILFGIEGNHSMRTKRSAGLSIDRNICRLLGVPYKDYSVLAKINLRCGDRGSTADYKITFHHGAGGGSSKGGKINASLRIKELTPTADAIFVAHHHTTGRTIEKYKDYADATLVSKERITYSTGSSLDWDESYADEKGLPPAAKEFIAVEFWGFYHGTAKKKQIYKVFGS